MSSSSTTVPVPQEAAQAVAFLSALFDPSDTVLLRPVETWTDNGRKMSKVDYGGTQYCLVGLRGQAGKWQHFPRKLDIPLNGQMERAEQTKANIFFGVCPRFGTGGQYDQAWQIRVLRALWADIDDCTPEETLQRCQQAKLPRPSVVVASGHGAHLYWLLAEPYLIDDVGDPAPVFTEFLDQGEGRKKVPRKFLKDPTTGEKLYLDIPQNEPKISPKAQHLQDILAGIAARIGGDHTQDLPRLLRVPGTLNRKDQRNGQRPVACELIELAPDRRYSLGDFERFADASPEKKRREQIAQVKLPAIRKPSPRRQDRLNELVLACATAEVGTRSEADFALCCYAIEQGIAQESVWAEVQNVGKFAEGGDRYFQRTWQAAEEQTRKKIFGKVQAKVSQAAGPTSGVAAKRDGEEEDSLVRQLADAIGQDNHFAQDAGGKLYRYAHGVYTHRAEEYVRAHVKRLCLELGVVEQWSSHLANEVVEFIRVDSPQLWERPPLDVLNVQNGLLRVSDRVLLPHSPSHLSPVQLPVRYDPGATCPEIEKFVSEVFPPDAVMLAWQVAAWLMLPDTAIQKAVLLTGEGANGKSTWLCLLITFLGKGSTCSVSLHKLEADKFAVARLIGKLANICPDLPSEHLAGTSTFKAITGGDTLSAEYKFKDSFDFIPFARLVFSANHPPRSKDGSHAFFRRWLVIPFDRTFSPEEQIPRDVLDARLSSPGELSGLLNKALDALSQLREQRGFSETESTQRAWNDFHATTDPLAVWLDCSTVDDPSAFVPKNTLRAAYNTAADQAGRPAMGGKAFGTALRKLRPDVTDAQKTVNGQTTWCYVGIGLLGGRPEDSRN